MKEKEMLGGCCVCSDEVGWNDNPLIYCDGPGCEVAVHQGCYGIQEVPEDEWYCAKCHVSTSFNGHLNGSAKPARCDLCPLGYGALKRTEKGGWAHVVCALYIPEVRFGDVHSMDPIVVSDIPADRFEKPCYLCQNAGNAEAAAGGACMGCNKPGCKRGFHVTCAQQRGLLCEESGGSKNVKYCGYCSHHMKKAVLDPAIKRIPPCRVRPHPTSSLPLHSQPTPPRSNNSGHMLVDPIHRPEQVVSVLGLPPSVPDDAHLVNNFSPPLTTSSRSSVALDSTPPLTSAQMVTKMEQPTFNGMPSTSSLSALVNVAMGQNHNRINVMPSVVPAAETNGHFDSKMSVDSAYSMHTVTPTVSKAIGGGKRAREVKLDNGPDKTKRPRTNNRQTKSDMKALLDAVGPVVAETVSDFQRERVAGRSEAEQRRVAVSAVAVASTSHEQNGQPPQVMPPVLNMNTQPITTLPNNIHLLGTSPSTSRGLSTLPSSMEQLLERQWDQCSQFMVSQAQFDVAQLLSCLHQLKSENIRLDEQLSQLTKRREHLLALNARLSTPLTAPPPHHLVQQPLMTSPHHSPQVPSSSALPMSMPVADDSLSQMRSLVSGQRAAPTLHVPAASTPSTSFAAPHTQHQQFAQSRHPSTPTVTIPSAPLSTPTTTQSSAPVTSMASSGGDPMNNISPERIAAINNLNTLSANNFLQGARSNHLNINMGALQEQLLSQLLAQQAQMRYPAGSANLFLSSLIPPINGPVQGGNIGK